MAKINGTNVLVEWGDFIIGGSTSCTLNIDMDTPDATTKDQEGFEENIAGIRSGTIDVSNLHDPAQETPTKAMIHVLIGAWLNRNEWQIYYDEAGAGDTTYRADGLMSDFSMNADFEQPVSFDVSFDLTGEIEHI
jgi:predicted secreted protein